MKTINRYLLLAMLAPLFFISCKGDDGYSLGDIRRSIATIENPENGSFFFLILDNGDRIWAAATSNNQYKPKDGQRVIADYTVLSDGPSDGSYKYDVKLVSAYNILTKGIFDITSAAQDSIGYDPIKVEDIWIGSDYLNIEFVYAGYSGIHFINLVADDSKEYNDGKTHLEFRHNANGDPQSHNMWGIASFDLRSLKTTGVESLPLVIHVRELSSSEEELYELNYTFNDSSDTDKTFPLEEEITVDIF